MEKARANNISRRLFVSLFLFVICAPTFVKQASGRALSQSELERQYDEAREHINRGEFEEAERLGKYILSVARRTADRHLEARLLSLIGNLYFYTDRQREALDYFQASLSLMRETGDRLGEAISLKDTGITLKALGRFDEAFAALYESLEIFRQFDAKPQIGSALENIGTGYATMGAYNLAFEMCKESLHIAREAGDVNLLHGSTRRIGDLYLQTDDPQRALQYLTEALEIAERGNISPSHQAETLMNLSNAMAEVGRVDEAISMRHRSMDICRRLGWKSGVVYNLQGLGWLYVDHDPARALSYFQKAAEIRTQIDSRPSWSDYISLAHAYKKQGDLNRAIEYYQKAVDRIETFRDRSTGGQHRATFIEKHSMAYRDFIEALVERNEKIPTVGDDIRAFNVLERARSRAMLDSLAEARLDLDQELDEDLHQRRKQMDLRITDLQKRLAVATAPEEEHNRILDQLNQAEEEYDRLIVEIKQRNPHYATLRYPDNLSMEEARALLDTKTAIIAYSITNTSVIAFVLTQTTFRAARLAVSPDALAARARIYADILSKDDGEGWREVSRQLYRELIKPLRDKIYPEIDHLVIVPDEVLHYLPFETLIQDIGEGDTVAQQPSDTDNSRFLVEDYAISYVPSATVLNQLRVEERISSTKDRVDSLVLANPFMSEQRGDVTATASQARALFDDEGLHTSPIPFAATEAEALRRYVGDESEIYTGTNASEQRIKAAHLDRFRVIHFATHGLISQRAPARSALALAPSEDEDGFLQAREIYHLKLASDLVVLSACQTARGRMLSGEGVQGIARAFFHAGAKSVVASLWNVNDEKTATFMEAFYRHLSEGRSKVEALRAAKLDMLSDKAASSPRYWAAFILIGESQEKVPINNHSWHYWPLSLAALLVALVAVFFFLKRRSELIRADEYSRLEAAKP